MASKLCRNRALASVLRPARPSIQTRTEAAVRCFVTTSRQNVALPKDAPNPRDAPRDAIGTLQAPPVNPVDKYQSKADNLHKYGSWLMGCLPKYIQQFSVWKDELTIYICPTGVIPVFSFLKCA
jgi:NADH dehydrogenase (ubiquinone) Fe-S protein 3